MESDKRFIKISSQGGFVSNLVEVWIDRQTGVNYMFMQCGNSAGLTPLLDRDGRPMVTSVPKDEE